MDPAAYFDQVEERQLSEIGSRAKIDGDRTRRQTMAGRWTDDDIARLRTYAAEGMTIQEAADELGRSMTSTQQKASKCKIRFGKKRVQMTVEEMPPHTPNTSVADIAQHTQDVINARPECTGDCDPPNPAGSDGMCDSCRAKFEAETAPQRTIEAELADALLELVTDDLLASRFEESDRMVDRLDRVRELIA